jgi:hypothetical protein
MEDRVRRAQVPSTMMPADRPSLSVPPDRTLALTLHQPLVVAFIFFEFMNDFLFSFSFRY